MENWKLWLDGGWDGMFLTKDKMIWAPFNRNTFKLKWYFVDVNELLLLFWKRIKNLLFFKWYFYFARNCHGHSLSTVEMWPFVTSQRAQICGWAANWWLNVQMCRSADAALTSSQTVFQNSAVWEEGGSNVWWWFFCRKTTENTWKSCDSLAGMNNYRSFFLLLFIFISVAVPPQTDPHQSEWFYFETIDRVCTAAHILSTCWNVHCTWKMKLQWEGKRGPWGRGFPCCRPALDLWPWHLVHSRGGSCDPDPK